MGEYPQRTRYVLWTCSRWTGVEQTWSSNADRRPHSEVNLWCASTFATRCSKSIDDAPDGRGPGHRGRRPRSAVTELTVKGDSHIGPVHPASTLTWSGVPGCKAE